MNNILKGTTIITSVTQEFIIIAADSKQTWEGDNSDKKKEAPLRCKIRHIGNLFFAAEGHTKMIDPDIDFLEIIEAMDLSNHETFIQKINFIIKELRTDVTRFLEVSTHINPIYLESLVNKHFLSISFSTFEHGSPKCIFVAFQLKKDEEGYSFEITAPENNSIPRYLIQGQKTAIEFFLAESEAHIQKLWDYDEINDLFNIQINSTPDTVGLPVDIVKINAQGHKWIQKKECE
jgi:hypothetical protein